MLPQPSTGVGQSNFFSRAKTRAGIFSGIQKKLWVGALCVISGGGLHCAATSAAHTLATVSTPTTFGPPAGPHEMPPGAPLERIAALVGKEIILESEVRHIALVQQQDSGSPRYGQSLAEVLAQVLTDAIEKQLFVQQAKRERIDVSEADLHEKLEQIRIRQQLEDQSQLEQWIQEHEGISLPQFRKFLKEQQMGQALLQRKISTYVSEPELQAAYQKWQAAAPTENVTVYEEKKEDLRNQILQERIHRYAYTLRASIHVEVRMQPTLLPATPSLMAEPKQPQL